MEYAGSRNTAGLWEVDSRELRAVKADLPSARAITDHTKFSPRYDLDPVQDWEKASAFSIKMSVLTIVREAGPRMLTMGTSLSDGVTVTVFVDEAHAPRKLHSVAWMLYC
jgi:hypothetical protein